MEAFDFEDWDELEEINFTESLESYRSLSLGELREMERPLTQDMKDQIKELRLAFKGLPSERGRAIDPTNNKKFLDNRQSWADAMFIVIFLH